MHTALPQPPCFLGQGYSLQTFLGRNTVHQKKMMSDSDMLLGCKLVCIAALCLCCVLATVSQELGTEEGLPRAAKLLAPVLNWVKLPAPELAEVMPWAFLLRMSS